MNAFLDTPAVADSCGMTFDLIYLQDGGNMNELLLVLDFGGQYKELIARSVRANSVYSEIWPGNTGAEKIRELNPIGIILTGGPHSVYMPDSPKCDPKIFELGIPVLGICY